MLPGGYARVCWSLSAWKFWKLVRMQRALHRPRPRLNPTTAKPQKTTLTLAGSGKRQPIMPQTNPCFYLSWFLAYLLASLVLLHSPGPRAKCSKPSFCCRLLTKRRA